MGVWGLAPAEVAKLPGMGDPVKQRVEAKKLLADAGFGPATPMKLVVSTRALPIYVDTASWMVDQLQQVGIEATLEQIETGVWHPKMTRLEYQVALNVTGIGIDDPDAQLFENYRCGSQRNFSGYCSEEIDRLKNQTLDGLRVALRQPGALSQFVAGRALFGDAPYGHSHTGTMETVQAIKRDDIVKLYQTYYVPENAALVLSGNLTLEQGKRYAEQFFGEWKGTMPAPSDVSSSKSTEWKTSNIVIDSSRKA